MAVFDRDYMRPRRPGLRPPQTWVWRLILICAVVWFVQMACRHWFATPIDAWFGLSLKGLGRGRVWGLFTYAFLHDGFGHLFWNGFGIWIFGSMLERSMPRDEFVRLTVWAAIAGGVGYLLGDVVMGSGGYVIGASGFLSAYLALAALRFPKTPIRLMFLPFFSFPLWVLAVVYFGFDVLGAFSRSGSGIAYWAHLGGAAYGAAVFRFGVFPRWSLPRIRLKSGDDGGNGSPKPRKPTHAEKRSRAERERVDALLDKINREGIGSLSDKERAFLNDASKRYH
jgi:membrane associated rhomboid family serine protease